MGRETWDMRREVEDTRRGARGVRREARGARREICCAPSAMSLYRGLSPTVVLYHRDAVLYGLLQYRGFRIPWVITHVCVISPRRGSKRMITNNYELCIMNYAL